MVPTIRTCNLLAAGLLFAAPAVAQSDPAVTDPTVYVRARAADAAGLPIQAASAYAEALVAAPQDHKLAARAYRQALSAGDLELAGKAATIMLAAGAAPPDTAIVGFTIAFKSGDHAASDSAIKLIEEGPLRFLVPTLRAWVALDRGQDPMPDLQHARRNAMAVRYAAAHRPLLLIASGRSGEGVVALASINDARQRIGPLRTDVAMLLAARGEQQLVIELIGEADSNRFGKYLRRAGQGGASFGIGRLFLELAGEIAPQRITPLSILLTRCALYLDPHNDRARLVLAEALTTSGAIGVATQELGFIPNDSPYLGHALLSRVAIMKRDGRAEDALPLSKSLLQRGGVTEARAHGDLLESLGKYAEAAAAYQVAIDRAGQEAGWELYLAKGRTLDRAGKWSEALPLLQEAATRGPDRVKALEYLGYAQASRRENIPDAKVMLERAAKLAPDDSSVAVALGWAYFVGGDTARALPFLEKAAKSDPGGTRANEHLGDAYWALGRRFEARYSWSAAKIYAEPDAAERLQDKLDNGLI